MALRIALLLAPLVRAHRGISRRALALSPAALALPANAYTAPAFIERELHFPTLKRTVTLTQAFGAARGAAKDAPDAGDRTGTYGWPGGDSLAYYLARHPDLVKRKRVLELGCGTGAVGIVCSFLGASKVLLTDGSPAVLETTSLNVKRNRASRASLQRLRWGYAEDLQTASPGTWDLVVAAEVAYQRETLPAFLATVAALLSETGRALVVMTPELADNGRGLAGIEKIMREDVALELLSVEAPSEDDDDDENLYTARYTLKRRAGG